MKPIIGITSNTLTTNENKSLDIEIAYTPLGFVESVKAAGALPLIIPITDPEYAEEYVSRCDALIMSGGQDVNPLSYGQEPREKLMNTNIKRDEFEIELVKAAIKHKKPLLGVRLVMQIYNVVLGGTPYQDLSEYEDLSVQHVQKAVTYKYTHTVDFVEDSWIGNALGNSIVVNSYHHPAINQLANDLKPVGWAKDGILEAAQQKDPKLNHYLIQWHPEWMYQVDNNSQKIFREFVDIVIN